MKPNMAKARTLRALVEQRLAAAAQEIFELFEGVVAEYEEEVGRQRRLLAAVYRPEVRLRRAGELTVDRLCLSEAFSRVQLVLRILDAFDLFLTPKLDLCLASYAKSLNSLPPNELLWKKWNSRRIVWVCLSSWTHFAG